LSKGDKSRINALFRKALKHGLCHTPLDINELIITVPTPTAYITFHLNATLVLLLLSELVATTLLSLTQILTSTKILRCLFQLL